MGGNELARYQHTQGSFDVIRGVGALDELEKGEDFSGNVGFAIALPHVIYFNSCRLKIKNPYSTRMSSLSVSKKLPGKKSIPWITMPKLVDPGVTITRQTKTERSVVVLLLLFLQH